MIDRVRTLYKHRELIAVLITKQLNLHYRGSVLGFVWTFMNRLLMMVVYTLVFSVFFRLEMENFTAFLFSGLLPWIWFVSSLQHGVISIIEGAGLIAKALFAAGVLPVVISSAYTVDSEPLWASSGASSDSRGTRPDREPHIRSQCDERRGCL